jgi:hypothetical protein
MVFVPGVGHWTSDVRKDKKWQGVVITVCYTGGDPTFWEWTPDGTLTNLPV